MFKSIKQAKTLRVKQTPKWRVFLYGFAGRAKPAWQGTMPPDDVVLLEDAKRAMARLEIEDPWPSPVAGLPSPAVFELARHVYPNGAEVLIGLIEEESQRRWKAEDRAVATQVRWMMLGVWLRIVLVLLTMAILGAWYVAFWDEPIKAFLGLLAFATGTFSLLWLSGELSEAPRYPVTETTQEEEVGALSGG